MQSWIFSIINSVFHVARSFRHHSNIQIFLLMLKNNAMLNIIIWLTEHLKAEFIWGIIFCNIIKFFCTNLGLSILVLQNQDN